MTEKITLENYPNNPYNTRFGTYKLENGAVVVGILSDVILDGIRKGKITLIEEKK